MTEINKLSDKQQPYYHLFHEKIWFHKNQTKTNTKEMDDALCISEKTLINQMCYTDNETLQFIIKLLNKRIFKNKDRGSHYKVYDLNIKLIPIIINKLLSLKDIYSETDLQRAVKEEKWNTIKNLT